MQTSTKPWAIAVEWHGCDNTAPPPPLLRSHTAVAIRLAIGLSVYRPIGLSVGYALAAFCICVLGGGRWGGVETHGFARSNDLLRWAGDVGAGVVVAVGGGGGLVSRGGGW